MRSDVQLSGEARSALSVRLECILTTHEHDQCFQATTQFDALNERSASENETHACRNGNKHTTVRTRF